MTRHPSDVWFWADIPFETSLEFVCTNKSQWLKQKSGGNFKLDKGMVGKVAVIDKEGGLTFVDEEQRKKAIAIVSDLDGTMIGDDDATRDFVKYWLSTHVSRGSALIYNTGRDIESFKQLLKEKKGVMLVPDAVICAVGTKVYLRNGQGWDEDRNWSGMISEGWDVAVVREAAYQALAKVGKEMMHFRPANEQNEFKITCGVNVTALDTAMQTIQESLKGKLVFVNLIYSGNGDWRYLDIVPIRAGKLQALEALASRFGFELQNTIACGDSGNDIQMMAGTNKGLIVSNAQKELLDFYQEQLKKEGGASGRLHISTRSHARGIVAGIEHFGFK